MIFFHQITLALVTGDGIHLVDLNRASKGRCGGHVHHALPEGPGDVLDIIFVQTAFVGNLAVAEIESYQIQARDPLPKRLMAASEYRAAEVIEFPPAVQAAVSLPESLSVVLV
ncbi:hypothetical protein DESA109040_14600 [Deinococcus saxicola]